MGCQGEMAAASLGAGEGPAALWPDCSGELNVCIGIF